MNATPDPNQLSLSAHSMCRIELRSLPERIHTPPGRAIARSVEGSPMTRSGMPSPFQSPAAQADMAKPSMSEGSGSCAREIAAVMRRRGEQSSCRLAPRMIVQLALSAWIPEPRQPLLAIGREPLDPFPQALRIDVRFLLELVDAAARSPAVVPVRAHRV